MDSRRLQKVAETYRHEISRVLLTEVEEPTLYGMVVTHVRLTPDMRTARVYFSIAEGKSRESEVLKALKNHKGRLRKELATRVRLKHTPDLDFFYDELDDLSRNVESLFKQLDAERGKHSPTE